MIETTLNTFREPWRKFPRVLGFYAVVWIVGAAVLTLIHVAFDKTATPPQLPSIGTNPTPTPTREPAADDISKASESNAWVAVLASNNVDAYNNFMSKFPNSQHAGEARDRITELTAVQMRLADADSSVQIIAQLLQNKESNPQSLKEFAAEKGFKNKYPLGYAIFYSDGNQLLSYETSADSAIRFDPSELKVTFEKAPDSKGFMVCLNLLPVRINGEMMTNFRNICFGGAKPIMHAVRLGNVSIDIEYLAASPRGAAWIIGMTP